MTETIIFLTDRYPYEGGEQFIESEIPHWGNYDIKLVIMPLVCEGKVRRYPNNVTVDKCLHEQLTLYARLKGLINGVFSKYFINELFFLIRTKKINIGNLFSALKTISLSFALSYILKKKNKTLMANSIYSYWNNTQAYSSCILKDQGLVKNVFTRCHGYDLYEYRQSSNYSPFKRTFNNSFNKWFVICDSAKSYLQNTYNVDSNNIALARLGVDIPSKYSKYSNDKNLHILSVSYCVEVKQIYKIINALQEYSNLHPDILLTWIHIGDGPLLDQLKQLAKDVFNKNIKFSFLGHLSNKEVKAYYENNVIDFFINTSASEGVPVSIMEAMSYGVPIIAPDVGGVSDLLDKKSCFLLTKDSPIENVVQGIEFMDMQYSIKSNRDLCHFKIANQYSAEVNFTKIIDDIINYDTKAFDTN
jgi:colanic acid/amylovoran biosynthesis glycosyltransferase